MYTHIYIFEVVNSYTLYDLETTMVWEIISIRIHKFIFLQVLHNTSWYLRCRFQIHIYITFPYKYLSIRVHGSADIFSLKN